MNNNNKYKRERGEGGESRDTRKALGRSRISVGEMEGSLGFLCSFLRNLLLIENNTARILGKTQKLLHLTAYLLAVF